jgi:hypothetical protein
MSDTPETNAAEERCIATGFKTGYVDVEFALQPERERNQARDQCHKLRRDRLAITRAYDDVCQKLDKAIDALEYIAGLDSSQAACAELCSAVGVAAKALEDME